jgi:hypothetical protein
MADYSAMKSYFEKRNLHYFTFSINSENATKAVISHLPPDKLAEDISYGLEDLGFSVIDARKMMANRATPNEKKNVVPLPLFLVTLTRNIKIQEIFKLNSLKHTIIKVELYRAQTDLKQCCNCQNFGHVWANCKHPPRCL